MTMETGPGTLYCAECGRPTPPDELARFGDLLVCPMCKDNYAQKLREGVAPQVTWVYGGFWIRFLATIIDGIILFVIGSIAQYALMGNMLRSFQPPAPGANPLDVLPGMFAMIGAATAINTIIHALYEGFFVAKLAATPGKLALGLKVIRSNGSAISLGRSFGRYFAKILSSLILLIGYIMAGFDAEKRALHDMICDTRVIKAR